MASGGGERGGRGRGGRGGRQRDFTTQLSMKLSGILRHGKDGFAPRIDGNGWLEITQLLEHSHFCQQHNVTQQQIEDIVANNDKQRYKISDDGLRIKANQGHTIDIVDTTLVPITLEDAAGYSAVVHGTYYKSLHPIRRDGLSKMRRTHIHLTASDRVDASIGVISGFRGSTEVLIYVDMSAAIADGIAFFLSENNVILCSGDAQGMLHPKYFSKIVDKKSGEAI